MSKDELTELLAETPEPGGLGELIAETVLRSLGVPIERLTELRSNPGRTSLRPLATDMASEPKLTMSRTDIAASLYAASQNYAVVVPFSRLPERLQVPWLRVAEAAQTYVSHDLPLAC